MNKKIPATARYIDMRIDYPKYKRIQSDRAISHTNKTTTIRTESTESGGFDAIYTVKYNGASAFDYNDKTTRFGIDFSSAYGQTHNGEQIYGFDQTDTARKHNDSGG